MKYAIVAIAVLLIALVVMSYFTTNYKDIAEKNKVESLYYESQRDSIVSKHRQDKRLFSVRDSLQQKTLDSLRVELSQQAQDTEVIYKHYETLTSQENINTLASNLDTTLKVNKDSSSVYLPTVKVSPINIVFAERDAFRSIINSQNSLINIQEDMLFNQDKEIVRLNKVTDTLNSMFTTTLQREQEALEMLSKQSTKILVGGGIHFTKSFGAHAKAGYLTDNKLYCISAGKEFFGIGFMISF